MSDILTYSVTCGGPGSNPGVIVFSWGGEYVANSDEAYINDPKIYFIQQDKSQYGYFMEEHTTGVNKNDFLTQYGKRAAISIEEILSSGMIRIYTDPSITISNLARMSGEGGQSLLGYSDITYTSYSTAGNVPNQTLPWTDFRVVDLDMWELETNIPIFETSSEASQYIQYGDNIQNAINNGVPSVTGRYFEIINIWTEGTWDAYGFTPMTGATEHFRCVRGYCEDERGLAMWPEPGINEGGLIYSIINTGSTHDLQYSEDGVIWHDTTTFPYNYFYRPRVDEVGTFKFALTYYTNRVPIFEDEETADDYTNGFIDINEALNYTDISNNYPGSDANLGNDTGDPDDGTDWGAVYTKSFFHNIYLVGEGALGEISNKLYDTTPGVWDDIKKGLEMYGDNPIESVMSLMYFPLDLDSVFTNVINTPNIYFGGYNFTMATHTANKLVFPDGYFECGSVDIKPTFNNWRDIKAMRLFIDLPYCGRYELDTQKYLGKTIKVIYYIDLYSGACLACLVDGPTGSRDGICLDQFNGVIGQRIPITLTDFAGHANAMINTLLGSGGQSVNNAMNIATEAASGASALSFAGGAVTAGAVGAVSAAKTVYGLQMNNINKFNQTRGGSSGMLNQYANQRPTFIFVYPESDVPANFNKMFGNPSNFGGSISNFYGYFEADTVKLNMPGATENEKEKARALLMGGVYIQ